VGQAKLDHDVAQAPADLVELLEGLAVVLGELTELVAELLVKVHRSPRRLQNLIQTRRDENVAVTIRPAVPDVGGGQFVPMSE